MDISFFPRTPAPSALLERDRRAHEKLQEGHNEVQEQRFQEILLLSNRLVEVMKEYMHENDKELRRKASKGMRIRNRLATYYPHILQKLNSLKQIDASVQKME